VSGYRYSVRVRVRVRVGFRLKFRVSDCRDSIAHIHSTGCQDSINDVILMDAGNSMIYGMIKTSIVISV